MNTSARRKFTPSKEPGLFSWNITPIAGVCFASWTCSWDFILSTKAIFLFWLDLPVVGEDLAHRKSEKFIRHRAIRKWITVPPNPSSGFEGFDEGHCLSSTNRVQPSLGLRLTAWTSPNISTSTQTCRRLRFAFVRSTGMWSVTSHSRTFLLETRQIRF